MTTQIRSCPQCGWTGRPCPECDWDGKRTTLFVVTLYPYDDGSEARYQFTTPEMAEAFAAKVNALPEDTLRYITGSGQPIPVAVWESGTYASVEEALEALGQWTDQEDEVCNESYMASACILPTGHGGPHSTGE